MSTQQELDEGLILNTIFDACMDSENYGLPTMNSYGIVPDVPGRERALLYTEIKGQCYQIVAIHHPHKRSAEM